MPKLDRDLDRKKADRSQAAAAPGSAVSGAAPAADRERSKLKDNVAASEKGKFDFAMRGPEKAPSDLAAPVSTGGDTKPSAAGVALHAAPRPAARPRQPPRQWRTTSSRQPPRLLGWTTGSIKGDSASLLAEQREGLGELKARAKISSAEAGKPALGPATEVHLEVTAEAVQMHVFEDLLTRSGVAIRGDVQPAKGSRLDGHAVPRLSSDKSANMALADGAERPDLRRRVAGPPEGRTNPRGPAPDRPANRPGLSSQRHARAIAEAAGPIGQEAGRVLGRDRHTLVHRQ